VSLPYELRDAREPPICAVGGWIPVKGLGAQIWAICALEVALPDARSGG
jgi:hypothetical protein